MSYIKNSLSKDEEIYQIFKHHWMIKIYIFINFVLAIASFGIWLIPAIVIWLGWKNTEQGVTNKRVISKHGIISIKTEELRLNAIESIFINQSITGRIYGYGTVTITGRGQEDVKLKWMSDPMRVKREIESIEYGEKRDVIKEKDSVPIGYHQHIEDTSENKKHPLLIACLVLITVVITLSIVGNNDTSNSPVQAQELSTSNKDSVEIKENPKPIVNISQNVQENTEPLKLNTKDALDEANKQINIVWNSTTKEIRSANLPEQREWLKQRENDCSLMASAKGNDDAIAQEAAKLNCMTAMTNQRTEILKQKIASLDQ